MSASDYGRGLDAQTFYFYLNFQYFQSISYQEVQVCSALLLLLL